MVKKNSRWKPLKTIEFNSIKKTQKVFSNSFSIETFFTENKKNIGFVLPKKKIRLAVIRNKIKRLVHETIRQTSLASVSFVIKAKKQLTKKNLNEEIKSLRTDLKHLTKTKQS
jgi:ribonuclease P protein component